MEDEIDLRKYVIVLVRHWRMIVGITVLAALISGIVSFMLPPTYEAVALMSVAPPRLQGVSEGGALPLKAYPDLALSDEVVFEVFDQAQATLPPEVNTLSQFRRRLKATTASDPTLLRLAVRDTDANRAAQIVNTWAKTLAERAGRLYGQDAANLATYQAQLTIVKNTLDDAERTLATFQANNQVAILTAQVNSQQAILTDYLNRVHQFELLIQDARDLRARLAKLDPNAPPSFTDDLVMLLLSAQAFGGQMTLLHSQPSTIQPQPSSSASSSPAAQPSESPILLQVQVSSGQSLSGKTVAEQMVVLDDLYETLQVRVEEAKAQVAALEPIILDLQGKLAEAQTRQDQLVRERDLAEAHYVALVRRVEDAKIAVQESANVVQVASEAAVPTDRVSPRRLLNTLLGGTLSLMLGAFVVLIWEWWRAPATVAEHPPAIGESASALRARTHSQLSDRDSVPEVARIETSSAE